MDQQTRIDELLESSINPNFKITLDSNAYKQHISAYECMLFHLVALSDKCIENDIRAPSVLILDYDKRIICNQKFYITQYNQSDHSPVAIPVRFVPVISDL